MRTVLFRVGHENMQTQNTDNKYYTIEKYDGIRMEISKFTDVLYSNITVKGDCKGQEQKIHFKNSKLKSSTNHNKVYGIVQFLNFIYKNLGENVDFENLESLIGNLTLEMIDKYIRGYAHGLLDDKQKKRSANAVNDRKEVITKFVAEINYITKTRYSKKRIYEMKYISDENFSLADYRTKSGLIGYKLEYIGTDFQVTVPVKKYIKCENATYFLIGELIEVAKKRDPMIAFAIVLSACTGLRIGEVAQMTHQRLKSFFDQSSAMHSIDLLEELSLREDNKSTGHIKVKRIQPVHPIFYDLLLDEYNAHCKLLKKKGLLYHKKGAIFFNKGGVKHDKFMALMDSELRKRFREIADIVSLDISIAAGKGDIDSINENSLIANKRITFHSIRHIYTKLLDSAIGDDFMIAIYRGDKNLNSQKDYKEIDFEDSVKNKVVSILRKKTIR